KRPVLPGRREFATEVVPLLPRAGMLLYITFRWPSTFPRRTMHRRFARFCADWTPHYLILLEWSASKTDPYPDSENGDGEHFHALVGVPGYDCCASAWQAGGDGHGIGRKARDGETVSGWSGPPDLDRAPDLRKNVSRAFTYITRPADDGPRRDF